jgi:hypothetical protein
MQEVQMGEMVERVAAALRKLPIRDSKNPGSELDHLRLREAARAAIEAMREPTKEMIDACDINIPTEGEIVGVWGSMIDEALK